MQISKLSNLTGRYIAVTGGTGRLGSTIVDTVWQLGASVVLIDFPGSDFDGLRSRLKFARNQRYVAIECDLELEDQRNSALNKIKESIPHLNCLINNAAFIGGTKLPDWNVPFERQSLISWRRSIEVNLTAPFHFSRELYSILKDSEGANILNITSIYGHFGPDWKLYENTELANPAGYSASKGGLAQLTIWLATTLAPTVRVNAIAPGGIYRGQDDLFVRRYSSKTPLKRMATEDDFRGAIAYLTSDQAAYVTGQTLHVDGGWAKC